MKERCTYALSFESLRLHVYTRLICRSHCRLPGLHHGQRFKGAGALGQAMKCSEGYVIRRAAAGHLPKHHDPAGVRIGQRIEQDWLDRAEDGRAGAYSHRQDHDGGHSVAGCAEQLPPYVANIRAEALQIEHRIALRGSLPHQVRIAEANQCVASGLLRRHALREIVFQAHFNVRGKFPIDFVIDFGAAKEICDAMDERHKIT